MSWAVKIIISLVLVEAVNKMVTATHTVGNCCQFIFDPIALGELVATLRGVHGVASAMPTVLTEFLASTIVQILVVPRVMLFGLS